MAHQSDQEDRNAAAATGRRLQLYVSYACPWSHRVLIARAHSKLEHLVEVINVAPEMDATGWRLGDGHLIDRYVAHDPAYAGKATVPLMVDAKTGMIVSNESAVLMRLLGTTLAGDKMPLFPPDHAIACEVWNFRFQQDINARVYDHGLAASGDARARKTAALVEALATVDRHLAERRYLVSDAAPLEPDWRLWVTLARYDLAYRPYVLQPDAPALAEFPHLARLFGELTARPGISATYRPDEIVAHYAARVRDLTTKPLTGD